MRLARHEALVACPRPGLEDVPCEADLLVAVRGCREDGLWIDVIEAPCGHTLTDAEEGLVLDSAADTLDRRYSERMDR